PTWACQSVAALFDQHMLGWRHEPEILVRADCCISNEGIWLAHSAAKLHLLDHVETLTGIRLDTERPILGFARRMTAYKRPQLLFSDLERLRTISRKLPFQIILAGKAHPHDYSGKDSIAWLHDALRALAPDITGVFLPNYDMTLAQRLVAGVDIWVNTPLPPLEASGTSGMKAAINGVPSLSVLDGWWAEGCIEGVTGWAIGDGRADTADAESLYNKLEQEILPLYYNDRATWATLMRAVISRNGSMFNSHRMVRRYAAETYL
ncbi:MAG TPA: alpha-glucan family phosphorylase, partial [Candidatus Kapabacteria bacterium]|nr:alpha-glucan family phosphorylase [Candidatus Kapabacteria bacterium]